MYAIRSYYGDFLKSIYISLDEIHLLVSLIKCISYGSEFDNNKDDLFLEAKIVSDADNRITSYNVCYTKLLRKSLASEFIHYN